MGDQVSCGSKEPKQTTVDFVLMEVLQAEGPFQGLRVGACLTLRNELSEEIHVLTKQDTYLERALGHPGGSAGKEAACSA